MSENQQAGSRRAEYWSDVACWLAVGLSLVVSVQHTGTSSQWHDDLGLIRTLGAWPLGAQGVISIVLAQFTSVVPIGNHVFRAGLAANIGVAAACWIYFQLVHGALRLNARTPRLSASLAMLSSLLLSLATPMQEVGTVAGGASVSVALCLAAISANARLLRTSDAASALRLQATLGALVVMAFVERYLACAAALLVISVHRIAVRAPRLRATVRSTLTGALIAAGACSVPLLRMLRPNRSVPELPSLVNSLRERYVGLPHLGWGGHQAWTDVGGILACAALLGGIWALAKPALRGWAFGGLAGIALANVFATVPYGPRESPAAAVRVLCFAGVILFATILAQTLAVMLLQSRITYVGGSAVVIPVAYGLIIAAQADEADVRADLALHNANGVFTQEALWALPQNSLLLLRTQDIALRYWADRLARGMRPDILVVTPEQLQYRTDINRLLELEPALAPLIRDSVLRGRASEYVLSQLADTRPLFVQLDTGWDARVREHLAASGLWLEFHPQSLGRSDRFATMNATRGSVDHVIDVGNTSVPPDRTTLHLLALQLKEQALVSASLGDHAGLHPLLEQLEKTGVAGSFAATLRHMLNEKPVGPFDWATLQAL